MTEQLVDNPFAEIARRIERGSTLLRSWPLTGGVSAEVTAIEVQRLDGSALKALVRRHGAVDLRDNPNIARDEYRLLEIAHRQGLKEPRPYFYDDRCTLFSTPYVVIEFVDGETEFEPEDVEDFVTQMAEELARIHAVPAKDELSFLPRLESGFGQRPDEPDASMQEPRIRDTLEAIWPLVNLNDPVLLHGDYWPGNLLWLDGKLAAVIDWEDARTGDPLFDVANARLELMLAFNADAVRAFTFHYRAVAAVDMANLSYWDLCAALRPCGKLANWGLDEATENRMRTKHGAFVATAMSRLSGEQEGSR